MYLTNSWYVAATALEIGRKPFARTILNEPIVLYRKEDGRPVGFEDRCCHRQLPLSMGEIQGDDLICGYHGLRYNPTGKCAAVPGQASPPAGAGVRSYPLLEKWGFVFIWMGEASKADEELLPNWPWPDQPGWKIAQNHLVEVDCDYRFINDNLIDVTHLAFVHKNSIGVGAIVDFPQDVEADHRFLRATRWVNDKPCAPMYQAAGQFTRNVDRAQIVEHTVPCYTVNHAKIYEVGSDEHNGVRTEHVTLSAATPESETKTHYFFTFARNYALDDPAVDMIFDRWFIDVIQEDADILDAQQMNYDRFPDGPTVNIAVDKGPMRARKMLDDLITAEQMTLSPVAGAAE